MRSLLVIAGALCFWMLSPESLTILSNGASLGPAGFFLPILLFGLLFAAGARIIQSSAPLVPDWGKKSLLSFTGLLPVLGCGGMIGTALFGSTGMLVTAGFTFNEVFLYYFPNFGFAFLLLFLVTLVHLFFPGLVRDVQAILVLVVCGCLVVLTAAGLFLAAPGQEHTVDYKTWSLVGILPFLFVFVGFEQRAGHQEGAWAVQGWLKLMVIVILLGWMTVASLLVSPQKLMLSTVPYMTAASAIAGQSGRLMMGIVIVCGSLVAVSGLFLVSRTFLADLVRPDQRTWVDRGTVILLTAGISISMAAGFAGDPRLEPAIWTGLTVWLFYGGLCVVQASLLAEGRGAMLVGGTLVTLVLLAAAVLGKRAIDPLILACLLAGSVLCIMVLWLMHEHSASQRRTTNKKET